LSVFECIWVYLSVFECIWVYLSVFELSYLIFWVLKWLAPFGAKILTVLIYLRPLAPNYLEHLIGSAPPLFILDPLLWIGSAYSFVYLNSCLWLNKLLTNLTSSHQHHLQYTGGLAETQGLLLPSLNIVTLSIATTPFRHIKAISSSYQNFHKRLLFLSKQSFFPKNVVLSKPV